MPTASYRCNSPGCGKNFPTLEEARVCEAQDPGPQVVKVGDIVTAKSGYGWFDGDPQWVLLPKDRRHRAIPGDADHKLPGCYGGPPRKPCRDGSGNCFGSCCCYTFLYVVTSVDLHEHEWRYSLVTLALFHSPTGHLSGGWTCTGTHYTPRVYKHPPKAVVEASKSLLGTRMENLL